MGKQRPTPSMRKNVQRKHVMELLRVTARPPQERWSIRESVNFKIALGRFGEDWPRIAQFVSTKTTHQACTSTHLQYLSPVWNHSAPLHSRSGVEGVEWN
ncbi:hypothetical protein CFC21_065530 [Triticum aestivum]|uniref:Myb-like domain-containing protein n=2 Tax=Triticum aestivum TaxID=4565 RepID=A0A9R1KLH2_WHEAT|nr:hypothetical protein CFC21_065530 [Triticum aestivum]